MSTSKDADAATPLDPKEQMKAALEAKKAAQHGNAAGGPQGARRRPAGRTVSRAASGSSGARPAADGSGGLARLVRLEVGGIGFELVPRLFVGDLGRLEVAEVVGRAQILGQRRIGISRSACLASSMASSACSSCCSIGSLVMRPFLATGRTGRAASSLMSTAWRTARQGGAQPVAGSSIAIIEHGHGRPAGREEAS